MATERKPLPYMVRDGLWMALPIRAEYSLEERRVDETRDFLSASSASPALLSLSLLPYVSELSSGSFSHKHLYYSVKLISIQGGEEMFLFNYIFYSESYNVNSGVNYVNELFT